MSTKLATKRVNVASQGIVAGLYTRARARVCIRAFPRVFVRVIACGTGNVGTREAIYNVPRY